MATTTNFGWTTPDDTDLVKDGAAAIRTLGSAIDTSLVDLKGGTTGQILSKTSNTDLDYTWINNDQGDITEVVAGTGLSGGGSTGSVTLTNTVATAFDAAGDLVYGTGADTFTKLGIGTAGQVLTVNSGATAPEWAAPAAAGFVGVGLRAAAVSCANNTATQITYGTEDFDTNSFHSTVTNTSRITIPSGKAGKYQINIKLRWDTASTSGRRSALLYLNGSAISQGYSGNGYGGYNEVDCNLNVVVDAAENDYFEVYGFQGSGGTISTMGTTNGGHFQMIYLGA